ncbi:polysaccharide deacetylase family protein [Hymenobacter sp. ASUV-10]|uniref:Polysaccharide deacetylase family protein n=1 Tax=Hymenobacter aranciens TaxID=3063996 RepID=A0ABT9BC16_9BACT|nr:polysaccharide deacetylase family protein [Hymenobacter sp. ASUV-10]MDO7875809.1 polysaccharide deacetylase family protein [Hymenobacter sp. ASUV-10]
MLTFRNSLILYTLTLAGLASMVIYQHFSLLWPGLLTIGYAALIGYGSARVESSFFVKTVCHGPASRQQIALTFDDGPTEMTLEILAILRRHSVAATFFCIGQRVNQWPDIVRQAHAEGHIIGNHSFSHGYWFDLFSTIQFQQELQLTNQAIQTAIGRQPALFRPPYGVTTPNLAWAIRQRKLTCVGWNVRTMDTVITNETKLLARAVNALAPGTIFLFHDHVASTARMLEAFILEARNRGYEFVNLNQLLDVQPYV